MNREELLLNAALTRVNQGISRYVLRVMDEASGHSRTEYTVPLADVELELSTQLLEMGQILAERARASRAVVIESPERT